MSRALPLLKGLEPGEGDRNRGGQQSTGAVCRWVRGAEERGRVGFPLEMVPMPLKSWGRRAQQGWGEAGWVQWQGDHGSGRGSWSRFWPCVHSAGTELKLGVAGCRANSSGAGRGSHSPAGQSTRASVLV